MSKSSLFTSSENSDRAQLFNLADTPLEQELVTISIRTTAGENALDNYNIKQDKSSGGGIEIDALLTGINLTTQVRNNVTYTLGNNIYLYVFGESVYNLTVSGYGYLPCKKSIPDVWVEEVRAAGINSYGDYTMGGEQTTLDAFNDLIDFYQKNNVAKEGKYCKIRLGKKIFKGYLINVDLGLTEQAHALVPFKLSFIGIFKE